MINSSMAIVVENMVLVYYNVMACRIVDDTSIEEDENLLRKVIVGTILPRGSC